MEPCLLVRPEPFPDESFKGYIIRLSEANGYPDPNRIYRMAGLYKYSNGVNVCMVDEKIDVSRLSQLTTLTEEQLLSLSFYNEIAKLEQNSRLVHKLWRFGTCVYKQQLCPVCLAETSYHRKLWDLNIVTTCPVHYCFLIDQCPKCQKKISPHRPHLVYCKCGFDFREAPLENVPKEQTHVSQLLHRKLFECTTSDISISNRPLEHMEFRHVVYVIMIFCDVISLYFHGNKRLQFAQIFKQTGLHHLVQHSVRIFEHWPDSFDSFVDELRALPKGMRDGGPMGKEFGNFHQKLQERLYHPDFMFVIQRLSEYLDQHDSVHPKAIERLKKRLYQKTAIQVNTQCLKDGQLCTSKDVMRLLAIGQDQIVPLEQKSIIKCVSGPTVDGKHEWLFDLESVEELLSKIQNHMQDSPFESSSMITFQKALHIFVKWGHTLPDFVHSIVSKPIRACGRTQEIGLNGFLFISSDIERAAKGEWLSVDDAARELSTKREVIISWIQKGFLPVHKRIRKQVYPIHPKDFHKFTRLYVSAIDLVKRHPHIRSSEKLIRWLASEGIHPVTGPKIDGGRGYLYRKNPKLNKLLV
ncbi:TniQ family protein [Paenibacillus rigui]|uniref:TniQ domain-containing protein n=1 Tax=Paenibacillus rigui TaxID=554312 RepID=A0A229UU74_9BACL|nr:TniQ family protein [Paenibacillus rigui]OXM87076.1 hypothetical protein CF651_07090 [Paenibacillus rigui]